MSESKEVARRVAQWLRDQKMSFREINSLSNELSKAFDALNIAFAPPVVEGSVKVRIAVVRGINAEGEDVNYVKDADEGNPEEFHYHDDTHRAIVEAWIPPVATTPTVAGRVV